MYDKVKLRIKNLLTYYRLVKRVSGKSKLFDLYFSKWLKNIPYNMYFDLCLYNKKWNIRQDFIYLEDDFNYFKKYNENQYDDEKSNKRNIIKKTLPYMKRKILFTSEMSYYDFQLFINNISSFFYKPLIGSGGKGIQKFLVSNSTSVELLFNKITSLPDGMIEETIVQNHDLDILCPNLLQTVRFTIFKHKDGPKIIFASLKTSVDKNAIVDNAHGGGIYANINLDTGKIQTNAFRSICDPSEIDLFDNMLYSEEGLSCHPITGTLFKGFKIPMFNEAKDFVLEISKNNDFFGSRLIGYDIAISEKGPLLIEANINTPGMCNVWQTACKDKPLKKVLEEMLEE